MNVLLKITGIVLLTCCLAFVGYAQEKEKKPKKYKSLEKALENPLEVRHLEIAAKKSSALWLDTSIAQLKNLEILSIYNVTNDASFKLHVPNNIYSLTKLRELRLQNVFADHLPAHIHQFTELRVLHLIMMEFKEIPVNICKLKKLEEVDFSLNDFSELPDCFGELKNLKEFSCTNNMFVRFPEELFEISDLTYIDLSNREGNEGPVLPCSVQPGYTIKNNKIPNRPQELNTMQYLEKVLLDQRYFTQ